mgnify:CR=1 FL=1
MINKKAAIKFVENTFYNDKVQLKKNKPHTLDDYIMSELKTYVYKYPYFIYLDPENCPSTIHNNHEKEHILCKTMIKNMLKKEKEKENI